MGAVEKFCDSLMSMLPICRYGQENIRYGKKDETVAETPFLRYNIFNENNKPQQSLYTNSNEKSGRF